MPENVQIQVYTTCTRQTFPEVLERYRGALKRVGCHDQQVLNWLTGIIWPGSDDDGFGDIYASSFVISPAQAASIECAGIEVSLYLHSAVPSIEVLPSWVGFNLLFELNTVKEHALATYRAGVGGMLWHIMKELAVVFPEPGVYFTDEWQENRAWRAIVEESGDPWFFDLALFPRILAEHFAIVPAGFQGTVAGQGFGFAQANRWEQLPWVEAEM